MSLLEAELQEESKLDVELYLKDSLAETKAERNIAGTWPTEAESDQIITLATTPRPLFIYASTLCRYVGTRRGDPVGRLQTWLDGSGKGSQLDNKLDEMYETVLKEVFCGIAGRNDNGDKDGDEDDDSLTEEENLNLKDLLRSIVLLTSSLPGESLASLLGMPPRKANLLENLVTVLNIQQSSVELVHKSFRDFLLRPKGTTKSKFGIDVAETHSMLAKRSLTRMQDLQKNMCGLEDYDRPVKEIDQATIVRAIPPDLRYACLNWVYHLGNVCHDTRLIILEQVRAFLKADLLHWLEALSLLERISEGVAAMSALIGLIEAGSNTDESANTSSNDLISLAEDALRFILASRAAIEQAPLQIYMSALIFSPMRSLVKRNFEKEIPPWVTQLPMIEDHWGACILTLYAGNTIDTVACSHSGTKIASCVRDSIHIWDPAGGALLKTLTFQKEQQYICLAFSEDDTQLVGVSLSGFKYVWDAKSGVLLKEYSSMMFPEVKGAAVSQDAGRVATFSRGFNGESYEIDILDMRTGEHSVILTSSYPDTFIFTANNCQIVSCYGGWSSLTLVDIDHGVEVVVDERCDLIALSGDGKRLAPWDVELGAVKIRDMSDLANGQILGGHDIHGGVDCLAISEDGHIVAAATSSLTLVWDTRRETVFTLDRHIKAPVAVVFLQGSRSLVCASMLGELQIWSLAKITSHKTTCEQNGSSDWLFEISPDQTKVLTSSSKETINFWDPRDGSCIQSCLESGSGSFAFSHDSKKVVTVSRQTDTCISIWDSASRMCLSTCKLKQDYGPCRIALSPDGMQVALANQRWHSQDGYALLNPGIVVHDSRSGAKLHYFRSEHISASIAFSHSGKWIVAVEAIGSFPSEETRFNIYYLDGSPISSVRVAASLETVALTISPDDKKIIGKFGDEVWLWTNESSTWLTQRIRVSQLGFDSWIPHLRATNATGTENRLTSELGMFEKKFIQSWFTGYDLTDDEAWITWNGQRKLWLPAEYRTKFMRTELEVAVLYCRSGQVLFIRFSCDENELH